VSDAWRRECSVRRCALECRLAVLRQCQAIAQRAVCSVACVLRVCDLGLGPRDA